MPATPIARKLSVEKKGNKYNRDEDQQFADAICHCLMLFGKVGF